MFELNLNIEFFTVMEVVEFVIKSGRLWFLDGGKISLFCVYIRIYRGAGLKKREKPVGFVWGKIPPRAVWYNALFSFAAHKHTHIRLCFATRILVVGTLLVLPLILFERLGSLQVVSLSRIPNQFDIL